MNVRKWMNRTHGAMKVKARLTIEKRRKVLRRGWGGVGLGAKGKDGKWDPSRGGWTEGGGARAAIVLGVGVSRHGYRGWAGLGRAWPYRVGGAHVVAPPHTQPHPTQPSRGPPFPSRPPPHRPIRAPTVVVLVTVVRMMGVGGSGRAVAVRREREGGCIGKERRGGRGSSSERNSREGEGKNNKHSECAAAAAPFFSFVFFHFF